MELIKLYVESVLFDEEEDVHRCPVVFKSEKKECYERALLKLAVLKGKGFCDFT